MRESEGPVPGMNQRRISPIPKMRWEHWDLNPGRRVSSVSGLVSGSSLQFIRAGHCPGGLPDSSHPRTPETFLDFPINWSP